ncbi:hypothetical protein JCM3770_001211 [Rhodotorula araucariae]
MELQFVQLSPAERRNPVSVVLNVESYNQLVDAVDSFPQHPVDGYHLLQYVRERVPRIDNLYTTYPDTPSVFHLDATLERLPQQPQPEDPRQQISWIHLACSKLDYPGSLPPLNPAAPPGPTVNYVRERDGYNTLRRPGVITHVSETFRVCITPVLEARSARLGLGAVCQPTARMYDVAGLIISLELMCLHLKHNVEVVDIRLYGTYASKVARLVPHLVRLNLHDLDLDSETFDTMVQLA